jgi:hypothetical protein
MFPRSTLWYCADGVAKTHTIFGGSGLGLFVCRSESSHSLRFHVLCADEIRNHRIE